MGGFTVDKKTIIISVVLFIIIVISWNVFNQLRNFGNRVDGIRDDLSETGKQQRSAINRIERIETGLGDSTEKIGNISNGIGETANSIAEIEKRIDTSQNRLTDSAELITAGQSILERIRARGKSEN